MSLSVVKIRYFLVKISLNIYIKYTKLWYHFIYTKHTTNSRLGGKSNNSYLHVSIALIKIYSNQYKFQRFQEFIIKIIDIHKQIITNLYYVALESA